MHVRLPLRFRGPPHTLACRAFFPSEQIPLPYAHTSRSISAFCVCARECTHPVIARARVCLSLCVCVSLSVRVCVCARPEIVCWQHWFGLCRSGSKVKEKAQEAGHYRAPRYARQGLHGGDGMRREKGIESGRRARRRRGGREETQTFSGGPAAEGAAHAVLVIVMSAEGSEGGLVRVG